MSNRTLPIGLKIEGKPGLVIGGGEVARRKIVWLIEAGVRVQAIAPLFDASLEEMASARPKELTLIRGEYASMDLSACLVVIAATGRAEVNQAVAEDARRAGVPVNVVDQPELCDFYVPATVRRGDLCLAIGTGGECPPLAARIRRDLEERYPSWYGPLTEALGRIRRWLLEERVGYEQRCWILDELCEPGFACQLKDLDVDAMQDRLRERALELMREGHAGDS